jgi:hypothetical protein
MKKRRIKSYELILDSPGIIETLEEILLEHKEELTRLKNRVASLLDKLYRESDDLSELEIGTAELFIYSFRGGKEIEELDEKIDGLCSALNKTMELSSVRKSRLAEWSDKLESLDHVRIEDVLSSYGLGNEFGKKLICCPIHDDKSPSFKVYPKTNSWYCFGCHKGGAPVNFVMEMDGVSFKEALNQLLNF